MKIRRVILEGVNNFERFDHTFEYDWTDKVPDSLLLLGPNGSGKTTLLNVMAGLWELFKQLIETSNDTRRFPSLPTAIPHNCQLAAMEIVGLEELPLWIFYTQGIPTEKAKLPESIAQQETYLIGTSIFSPVDNSLRLHFFPPGADRAVSSHQKEEWNWIDKWKEHFKDNILGKYSDLPNMVFIESEARKVPRIKEPFQVVREPQEFRWLARYEPTEGRKGSLENYLYNLSAVDKPTLDQILEKVNAFLIDKRIVGFDKRTSALMVEVDEGGEHTIDLLSSGEKQMLLLIAFITRWLRPGGIVLIDEPDLHLHVSWTDATVSLLRRMVAEQDGQLIIASHEPSLWRHFTQSHHVRLGFPDTAKS